MFPLASARGNRINTNRKPRRGDSKHVLSPLRGFGITFPPYLGLTPEATCCRHSVAEIGTRTIGQETLIHAVNPNFLTAQRQGYRLPTSRTARTGVFPDFSCSYSIRRMVLVLEALRTPRVRVPSRRAGTEYEYETARKLWVRVSGILTWSTVLLFLSPTAPHHVHPQQKAPVDSGTLFQFIHHRHPHKKISSPCHTRFN
jgi:hypothetical protein